MDVVDDIKKQIFNEKREDVKSTAKSYGVTLKDYQIDALADIRYQGYSVSGVISSYKSSGLSSATRAASSGFAYGDRGNRRWTLFSTGKYLDASGKEIVVKNSSTSSNSSIISKAKEIHNYMVKNKYMYSLSGSELANTFQSSKSKKKVCCATYVSWVLQESGYLSASDHTNGATSLYSILKNKGWKEVSSFSSAKAGDVLFYSRDSGKEYYHTDIYAGNNKVWNAGNPKSDGTYSTRP